MKTEIWVRIGKKKINQLCIIFEALYKNGIFEFYVLLYIKTL